MKTATTMGLTKSGTPATKAYIRAVARAEELLTRLDREIAALTLSGMSRLTAEDVVVWHLSEGEALRRAAARARAY